MKLSFVKAEGTGNDFVIVDAADLSSLTNLSSLAKNLCCRKKSIGADGLLIYEQTARGDFKMRIFNPDGSEAEMCGNGIRCIAQYAKKIKRLKKDNFNIETKAGNIAIDYLKEDVPRLKLPPPRDLKLDFKLDVDGEDVDVNYVIVGVPHIVLLCDKLDEVDIADLGRKMRFHKDFAPGGTNVNFVKVTSSNSLKVRTYERGVEEETLACGSGVSASAFIAFLLEKVRPPVSVTTSGGETLKVYIEGTKEKIEGLYLEGKANLVFRGEIEI